MSHIFPIAPPVAIDLTRTTHKCLALAKYSQQPSNQTVHVPDGFINAPASAATGVVAVGAIAVSLRGTRRELDERTAPLAGPVAAFIFCA